MARKRQNRGYAKARKEFLKTVPHVCHYCSIPTTSKPNTFNSTTVDHIKPQTTHPHLAKDPTNFVVACGSCNSWKSNMSYETFMAMIKVETNRDYKIAA